jgi:glycosyltransferase involved in cell wall biosynthesis
MTASILFLGSQMTVGGAQNLLFTQARWFHNQGYPVVVAFFYDKDGLWESWTSTHPFPIIDLKAWRPGPNPIFKPFLLLRGTLQLWRLLRGEEIDVVETFTPDSNLVGLFIARLAGVPVRIATHHGYIEGAGQWRRRAHGWLINQRFAHTMVAVSERVRQIAVEEEGVRPDRVQVILNGIDPIRPPKVGVLDQLKADLGIQPGNFIYLTVGRLTLQKGHTYLLEAVPRVLESFPKDTLFLIAGDGHQREILAAKTRRLGLEDQVRFLGLRADVHELLWLADVFVLPSLWEGLPLALLEAMSVGLPVVASRVEGVDGVISDGKNGYLVPPKDVQALAEALVKIREHQKTRQVFGRRNAALVQRDFTIDRMCSHYKELFLKIYQQEACG